MTPEKEAKALLEKYNFVIIPNYTSKFEAKQCALIAADEILTQFIAIYNHFKNEGFYNLDVEDSANFKYWEKVKEEIEKL
jgi:hypothetical protein